MTDRQLLSKILDMEDLNDNLRVAFEDMETKLKRYGQLTEKQRAWATSVLEGEKYDPEPEYQNGFSTGLIPRGSDVPLPEQLKPENLPKRPPGRRLKSL